MGTTITISRICGALRRRAQASLAAEDPDRFFRPPYVGHRGWIGVRLDGDVDWTEVAELAQDAYRAVAPARLIAILDA